MDVMLKMNKKGVSVSIFPFFFFFSFCASHRVTTDFVPRGRKKNIKAIQIRYINTALPSALIHVVFAVASVARTVLEVPFLCMFLKCELQQDGKCHLPTKSRLKEAGARTHTSNG